MLLLENNYALLPSVAEGSKCGSGIFSRKFSQPRGKTLPGEEGRFTFTGCKIFDQPVEVFM